MMTEPIPSILNIEKPVSLKEQALKALKVAIITHQLKPGKFYSEVNLAGKLGISKTPV